MDIVFLVPVAVTSPSHRAYDKGDSAFWEDKADAQRLIKAGYAKPAKPGPVERS